MSKREWWQRPQIRTDEEEERERKATWLELFFDLYFVVVIAELAHHLATHPTWSGLWQFIFLFIPVWWIWIGSTYYIERFETEGIEHRLIVFAQMIPIAGLAVFAHDGLGDTSVGYGLSYAVCRTFQIFLWWRGGYHDPRFRPTSQRYVRGFGLGVLFFWVSILVEPPIRFWLWGLGLLIDLITPAFTLKQQAKLPRMSSSKLPERYGLFTIIVLGESVVGVVGGLAEQSRLTFVSGTTGILGMLLAFGVWWVYFDFIGRRPPKPSMGWTFIWGYTHLPLTTAMTATGAGILNAIAHVDEALTYSAGLLISGAIATSLTMMGILESSLRRAPDEPTHPLLSPGLKFLGAVIALLFGIFSKGMNVLILEALLILPILIQMVYGAYVWFNQELEDSTEP